MPRHEEVKQVQVDIAAAEDGQLGERRPRAIPVLGQLLHELHALNLTHEQLVRFLDPRRECELVHVKDEGWPPRSRRHNAADAELLCVLSNRENVPHRVGKLGVRRTESWRDEQLLVAFFTHHLGTRLAGCVL